MNRSLGSMLVAASMLALGAGAANAQTLPASGTTTTTTTPPATTTTTTSTTATTPSDTTVSLPAACQPGSETADENHGQAVRDCVEALRAQFGDEHGIGQWVSDFARGDDRDDDADVSATTPTTGTTTTATNTTGTNTTGTTTTTGTTATGTNTTGTTTTTGTTSTASTSTLITAAQPEHGHGHGHQSHGGGED